MTFQEGGSSFAGRKDYHAMEFNRVLLLERGLQYISERCAAKELDEKSKIALKRRRCLHLLNDLFGSNEESRLLLDEAIELLSTRRISRLSTPSTRSFFVVDAQVAAAKRHICFHDFCSCPYFFAQASKPKNYLKKGMILCKHLLAVKIAPFVASLHIQQIQDHEFHATLASRCSLLSKGPPPSSPVLEGDGNDFKSGQDTSRKKRRRP